jgi:hypothetical protein
VLAGALKRQAAELKGRANVAKLGHAVLHEGLATLKAEEDAAAVAAAVGNRAAALHHITVATTGAPLPPEAHAATSTSFAPHKGATTADVASSAAAAKTPGVKHYKGWLTKRAVISGRNWKRRYFVLSVPKRTLAYYDGEKTEAPKRVFLLGADCSAEAVVRTGQHAGFKSNCLKLTTHNSSMYAAAKSAAERDLWIDAINRVADMAAAAAAAEAAAAEEGAVAHGERARRKARKGSTSRKGSKNSSSSARRRERAAAEENPHHHEAALFDMGREHLDLEKK